MTMDIERADIVISLNGRDTGKRFYVLDIQDGYALLCDGKTRRVEKPKRKKLRHIRFDLKDQGRTAAKIRNGEKVNNSEIRRSLAEYGSAAGEKGGM
jgi:ribosomal protein L14E/L6E/L27E